MAERPQPAYDGNEAYIFVTYAHEDTDIVHPHIRWLQDQGFNVWWDEGISPGAAWRAELADAIQGCSLLLYFITPQSVVSDHCTREVNFALDEHRRPVLAVHLAETTLPGALGLSLSDRQAILHHGLTPEDYERKLVSAVATYLDQPVRAAGAPRLYRASRRARSSAVILTALIAVALGFTLGRLWPGVDSPSSRPERPVAVHSVIDLHPEAPIVVGGAPPLIGFHSVSLALSPSGRYLAYVGEPRVGEQRIYLRDLGRAGDFRPVAGTEGAIYPFFSPDSEWLGFLTTAQLKKVAVRGGAPVELSPVNTPLDAWWAQDDAIYVHEDQGDDLTRTSAMGGATETLDWAAIEGVLATDPSPNEAFRLLLAARSRSSTSTSADHRPIQLLGRNERKSLNVSGYGARYVPTGHLVFGRGGALYAAAVDPSSRAIIGRAAIVVNNVAMDPFFSQVHATVSENGLLAYVAGGDSAVARLQWLDREGTQIDAGFDPSLINYFDLAPDDARLVVQLAQVQDRVAVLDLRRNTWLHLPADRALRNPIWHPTAERLAVTGFTRDGTSIGSIAADGSADYQERLHTDDRWGQFNSVRADLALLNFGGPDGGQIFSLAADDQILPVITSGEPWGAEFSPDGLYLAYATSATGRFEVRVRSHPGGDVDRQVSTDGGIEPVWCRACDELFYRKGNVWYASEVRTEPALVIGTPRQVWQMDGFVDTVGRSYDVSRDGRRLLALQRINAPIRDRIFLVHDWFNEVERRTREP